MHEPTIHPASFRDPSGFVFKWNNTYYRQVNKSYAADYDLLIKSGLYRHLSESGSLISHTETDEVKASENNWYKTLFPQQIKHITFPYEWCFLQLKDAALLTLHILKTAIAHGMVLKDATPYNIQFIHGRPVHIDTLSFETYDPGKPWVAYRQFCNMFLFPLYLEHFVKTDIQKTLIVYPDGIPVDITSKLLPIKSRTSLGVWLHVYLQNTVTRNAGRSRESDRFNTKKLLNLADHLEHTITHMKVRVRNSTWNRYYHENVAENYLRGKEEIFRSMLNGITPCDALDVGTNNGHFAKILAENKFDVVAIDSDSTSINALYEHVRTERLTNIMPLVVDVANPTPATGFQNAERPSFHARIQAELVTALAIIHHLVIGKNIPLSRLATWFAGIAKTLIIEFVPRDDEKVVQMLASRKDVFSDYTKEVFEHEFARYFHIKQSRIVPGSIRSIYLMEKR